MIGIKRAGCYYVVTADIIGSRKINAAPERAEEGLARINEFYPAATTAAFTLYRGDEIQGVLAEGVDLARFIRRFRFFLRPLALRIGVGCGDIATGLKRKYSWQMDGSAFHYSREALEKIKERRAPASCFAGEDNKTWQAVNTFYSLLDAIQNRWSDKQWRAIDAYERCGTFEAAARELGITSQNVYKRCQAADWKAVAEAERYLAVVVKEGV